VSSTGDGMLEASVVGTGAVLPDEQIDGSPYRIASIAEQVELYNLSLLTRDGSHRSRQSAQILTVATTAGPIMRTVAKRISTLQ
jgi:hypothetical protein